MQPDLIVGFGLNNSNPSLDILKKWFKVMFNGDWTEQSLEKPNGLSFLVLYGLDSKANSVFSEIERRIQRYFGFSQKRHESQQFSAELCSKINGTYHKATVGRSISKMLKLIIYGETQRYWKCILLRLF
jgi:hypothetical protein